jgi:FAD/FMN-containing dehydrogenase
MYGKVSPEVVQTLRKVKQIFDPGNIMKPGALCFGEVGP